MANLQNGVQVTLSPADAVLSCTICQETLSDIYADDDGNRGLHRHGESGNGSITKFWLTECAHLTCGKHFEGGGDDGLQALVFLTLKNPVAGVPFYPDHEVPRAACPLCTAEKGDRSLKSLFFVNGSVKGQYDTSIPDAYFEIPPVNLVDGDASLEALRVGHPRNHVLWCLITSQFQYLALIRYGLKTHEKTVCAVKALRLWENKKADIVRSLSTVTPLREYVLCLAL